VKERSDTKGMMLVTLLAVCVDIFSFIVGGQVIAGSNEKAVSQSQRFRDCVDCPAMVTIQAGSFLMGSSAQESARDIEVVPPFNGVSGKERPFVKQWFEFEHPQHFVKIDRPFAMSMYRVTRGEFSAFVRETGYSTAGGCVLWIDHKYPVRPDAGWQNPGFAQTDQDPVVCVSWQDTKAYLAWLNSKALGRMPMGAEGPYRLPSEAEWEYAARAGTQTARWWGDSIGSGNADCDGCGSQWDKKQTAPSGSFQINPFGLADVLGNAWEWTEDCWNETHSGAPNNGSASTTGNCISRVMKGGDWSSLPWILRSASRSKERQDIRSNYIGFRIAKTIQVTQ